jgi:hypothetical protein
MAKLRMPILVEEISELFDCIVGNSDENWRSDVQDATNGVWASNLEDLSILLTAGAHIDLEASLVGPQSIFGCHDLQETALLFCFL